MGKIPWRKERLPTAVFRLGEFHGLYSPCCHESQTRLGGLHFHFFAEHGLSGADFGICGEWAQYLGLEGSRAQAQ